jgi:hypothetical protein
MGWNLYAHTSPVYLRHDGRGIGEPLDALRMADAVRFTREQALCRGSYATPQKRDGYLALCDRAIAFYEDIALSAARKG